MDKASSSGEGGVMRNSDGTLVAANELEIYDHEDEARRLLKEIRFVIDQFQESKTYAQFREQIASDEFQNQLKSVLGSNTKLNIVLYALGSLVYNFESHFQLAVAVLLKRDCSWINQIEVYDPLFVPADVIVLKELGCHVLEFNERGRRRVEEPTLFYMPSPEFYLLGNLLEANWCPSQINKLIILTNRMKRKSKMDEYTKAIHNYVKELVVEDSKTWTYSIISGFAWHFFEIDSHVDMDTFFQGEFSKEDNLKRQQNQDLVISRREPADVFAFMEEFAEENFRIPFVGPETKKKEDGEYRNWLYLFSSSRAPRKYRCQENAPPKDWIKLNISGIAADENTPAAFGGIFHDEFMNPILSFSGFMEMMDKDESAAYVEALKRGLTDLKRKTKYRKLIVEADNLKVIQWVNRRHNIAKTSEEVEKSLNEVLKLLKKKFTYVAYHIYEETNSKAHELAKKGAMAGLKKRRIYLRSHDKKQNQGQARKKSTA